MKTKITHFTTNLLRRSLKIAFGALVVLAATQSHAVERTLVLLQENSGRNAVSDLLPPPLDSASRAIVDRYVENGEAGKFDQLWRGHYQKFINLSDQLCTRSNLLNTLVAESLAGHVVDLIVLGHGTNEVLVLHNDGTQVQQGNNRVLVLDDNEGLWGKRGTDVGNLRRMLADARQRPQCGPNFKFNLRLVYMCNCYGSTLNDDWLAIGAKTSVGSKLNNYMPEPMITFFWNGFVLDDKRVTQAASDSFVGSAALYAPIPGMAIPNPFAGAPSKIEQSRPVVAGNGDLIFHDEFQLAVNQSRTVAVQADKLHNWANVYLVAGQTYNITAVGYWKNADHTTTANGYTPEWWEVWDNARRYPNEKMMRLIGERNLHNGDASPFSFILGSGMSLGASKTLTASGYGFLSLFANDWNYTDNSGHVAVTVKRIR